MNKGDIIKTISNNIDIRNTKTKAMEIQLKNLIVSEKVREACKDNKCGKYGKNYMCPPFIKDIDSFKKEIKEFDFGIILLKESLIENPGNINEMYISAKELHRDILKLEKKIKKLGISKVMGLIGGDCKLCNPCNAAIDKGYCQYPNEARSSLEAMGIDVIKTCKNININIEFKNDRVIWVGLLLIKL